MKSTSVTVTNVNPHEFGMYADQFKAEGFTIAASSIDGFTAIMGGLKLNVGYVRNQQVVNVDAAYSAWQPGLTDQFIKDNVLRVLDKEDSTGKVQSKPVTTPIDSKTGAVVTPPKPPVVPPVVTVPPPPAAVKPPVVPPTPPITTPPAPVTPPAATTTAPPVETKPPA